jgi:hypothetical protein
MPVSLEASRVVYHALRAERVGERCRTETLVVDPGDELYLEIRPELASMPEFR